MDLEFLDGVFNMLNGGKNWYADNPASEQRNLIIENRNDAMAIGGIRADKFDVQRRKMICADHNDVFARRTMVINWHAIRVITQEGQSAGCDQAARQDENANKWGRTWNSFKARESE